MTVLVERATHASLPAAAIQWRWVAVGVFVMASVLNFLDRQLLAAVAPMLRTEFGLSNADYGTLVAAFSMTYMLVAPLAGWFIDRLGLRIGLFAALGLWSLTSVATGFAGTYRALLGCRMALGIAEAAGVPAASKSNAMYLQPREFGLGLAFHSIGVTMGSMAAPLIVAAVAPAFGWRAAFVACGVIGLLWLPLFWLTTRSIPAPASASDVETPALRDVLADRRLWGILVTNTLVMATHSLWMNWTTIYFVERYQLSPTEANQYFAWIPPIFASLGGFFGGWLALRRIHEGRGAIAARRRICEIVAPALLVTAVVPMIDSPLLAAGAISVSFFACMTFLNNLHVMPLDLFGPGRAAFTTAALASSYALVQIVLSPLMGAIVDRAGFGALCIGIAVLPLAGIAVLRATVR